MSYEYPTSILEAAKILDEDLPKWHEKIDVDRLDMSHYERCILGQLYEEYAAGMSLLFNVFNPNATGIDGDKIFGSEASQRTWKNEIDKRKRPPPRTPAIVLSSNERTQLTALVLGRPSKLTDKQKLDLIVKLGQLG